MILILNAGSSSLKFKLYDNQLTEIKANKFTVERQNFDTAIEKILSELGENKNQIEKIGYRIVHGGNSNKDIYPVNIETMNVINQFAPMAPHHNPAAIKVIKSLIEKLPSSEHFVVFDTSFFAELPLVSKTYAIDRDIANKYQIHRYGFHGISHQSMVEEVDNDCEKKLITLHLGAGCSISAIDKGKPIDTSMGFTPIEGLVMQTRSGDIDPEIVLFLSEKIGTDKTKELIEHNSGLAGLSGKSGDMLELLSSDDEKSKLAIEIFCYRAKKYIGSYTAALGGVDEIVFSGEIGFGSEFIREKILFGLDFLGCAIKTVKPDEELAIAKKIIS